MWNLLSAQDLIVALCLIPLCWYLQFYIKRRRLYKLAKNYNGPPSLPIIGDLLKCIVPTSEVIDGVIKSSIRYKSPQRLWLGPTFIVHIFDPEDIKIVLNSPHALAKQPHLYKMVESITGRGLATSPVEEWKRHRKLIAPTFNQKYLDSFFDSFCYYSRKLVKDLQTQTDNGIFDVQPFLVTYSVESILDTLLGLSEDGNTETIKTVSGWIELLFSAAATRCTKIWYYFDFTFERSRLGKNILEVRKKYDAYIHSLIEKWKAESLKKVAPNEINVKNRDLPKPTKLIEHLVATSDGSGKFTDEELRGEVNTIIAAAYETVATVTAYTLMLLGMHPEIQEKVYNEISQVMGAHQTLELEGLKHLDLLERVLKESMRIFTPASFLPRYANQEIQLTNHIIPADTTVVIGLLALHRNPNIWPDPTKFDPDRFLPEEEAKRHPYSWIPFSGGPRNCIGTRFAWMSLKIVMAFIIMNYKISTNYKSVNDVKLTIMVKLQPTDGFKISITPR